ncbi:serine/threonine-protein kinase [Enhygromyxa salina]|uniref:Serine/threonine-protein kinase PrkC n=1 Tax=Enhygromyxa salina TaxID=215803 RepID=A0A2S9XZ30_9BACT|nr:serine/threonine-protein kinase [Enhygromyxa salina]PRP98122.1 Serine/threonine-protein kinase PrkC [Enhygromyxa salina]
MNTQDSADSLFDRFEVLGPLGEGGMGTVSLAYDRRLRVRVALKTVGQVTGKALLRFKHEFRSVKGLAHPNLVSLGELFESEGQWYLSMEYIDGTSFLDHVRPIPESHESFASTARPSQLRGTTTGTGTNTGVGSDPRLLSGGSITAVGGFDGGDPDKTGGNGADLFEEGRLRHCLLQLVDATRTLHESGRVHRDLKPSNVLVTPAGRVVILDFGLISEFEDERAKQETKVVGTPAYMAPEQASGLPTGPPADWYAVGVMLYEALCGSWPVTGTSLTMMSDKQFEVTKHPSALTDQAVPEDLEQLCMELLAVDPSARPTGETILQWLGAGPKAWGGVRDEGPDVSGVRELPCVGREFELAELSRAVAATRTKQARQILILGESGIGKSALVREAISRSAAQVNMRPWILRGRCHEHEQVRFKAFDTLVDQLSIELPERFGLVEIRELLPRQAWLLCRAFPVLQRVRAFAEMGVRHGSWQHRGALQRQMFAAFRELFARLAERSHLVLVIEDLQWADPGSWSLLSALTSGTDAPPLAVLATGRTELLEAPPEAALPFLRSPSLEQLTLGPLTSADITVLAELHGRPVDGQSALAHSLVEAAAGHPFFLDVLLRSTTDFASAEPPSLAECLWTEIAPLAARERAVLDVLAIAERPLEPADLASLARLDGAELNRALDVLRARLWIRSTSGAHAGRVEVYHDQIRQTLLAHIDPDQARATHLAIARMLEVQGEDVERLVSHLLHAGEEVEAAGWAVEAADVAMSAMAFQNAVQLYNLALRHPPEDSADRQELLVARAHALAWTGRGIEAAHAYLDAETSTVSVASALELRTKAAIHLLSAGQFDTGVDLLADLGRELSLPIPRGETTTMLHLLRERTLLRLRGFRPRAGEVELGFEERLRLEICSAASRVFLPHDMFLAGYFTAAYVRLALRSQDPDKVAIALSLEGVTRSYLGQNSKGEQLMNDAEALLDGLDAPDPFAIACVALQRGVHIGLVAEDCEQYRQSVTVALRKLRRSGRADRGDDLGVAVRAIMTSLALLMRTIASARAGDYRSLEAQLREYLDDARGRDDRSALIHAYVSPDFGMTHLIQGRPDALLATVDEGLALLDPKSFTIGHLSALLSKIRCAIYDGKGEEAMRMFDAGRGPMRASMTVRAPDAKAEACGAEISALLAVRAGRPTMSHRPLLRPIKFLLAYPGTYHRGRGEAYQGVMFAQDGDRARARVSLETALASFVRCRALPYAAAARLALASLSDDRDRAHDHRTQGLRFFLDAGVAEPERLAQMLIPGLGLP